MELDGDWQEVRGQEATGTMMSKYMIHLNEERHDETDPVVQ